MCAVSMSWSSTAKGEAVAPQMNSEPSAKLAACHPPTLSRSSRRTRTHPVTYTIAVKIKAAETQYDSNAT